MRCCIEKLSFFIINILSLVCLPLVLLYLAWRLFKAKEEKAGIWQRFGLGGPNFSQASKPIIWLHGVSVGEILALFKLIQKLLDEDYNILVTTTTTSSAALVRSQFALAIEQGKLNYHYSMLDFPWVLAIFLKNWPIKLFIACESEIWPVRILKLSHNHIPQILLNATLSKKTFIRWYNMPSRFLFSKLNLVVAQNPDIQKKYVKLGAPKVFVGGNLKMEADPLIKIEDKSLLKQLQPNKANFIAAISTHKGEEKLMLEVYSKLKLIYKDLKLILVPRHINRCPSIIKEIEHYNFRYCLKSNLKTIENIDVILGDVMGSIGFFLSLSSIAFIGKSLGEEKGGHNPLEPAMMKVAILSGPKMENFLVIYEDLLAHKAALIVKNEEELYRKLDFLLKDPSERNLLIENAQNFVQKKQGVLNYSYSLLSPYLAELIA